MIPVKYNVRNLRVRWVSTLMTALATGLVVWCTVLTFGLSEGLAHALRVTGDKLDLIVLRNGSNDESSSNIEPQIAREIANLEGVAKDSNGNPMCSSEYVTILTKPRRYNKGTVNMIIRGLQPEGRGLRPNFKIVQGRDLQTGVNELITSKQMAERFENLAMGEQLEINKVNFTVVGYFEAAGSSAESEVWTDIRDLTGARRLPDAISSVNLRVRDEMVKNAVMTRLKDDERFKFKVVDEQEYFSSQMTASEFVKYVGVTIASFLTLGAMFSAANTMYAAVASRSREIGSLRAIGFSRFSVLMSFMFESVLLCLIGGVLGCIGTLPLNGYSTGTMNFQTFSEITFSFRFGPSVLLSGVLMAATMGVLGGLFPAIRAVRMPIVTALREN